MLQMTNTRQSFHDKWSKNESLVFAETLRKDSDIYQWILGRNGFHTGDDFEAYLSDKRRILDAGCGNGRVTALLREHSSADQSEIVAIDLVAAAVAANNLAAYRNITVLEKDLLSDLGDLGRFDFIYCQEVLHHTSDPRHAFGNLCALLNDGGEIAIYVYKQKVPAREFVDDYIRERISDLAYEDAMHVCQQITELGRILSELTGTISVPAVNILQIEPGEYTYQRFIYHFFMKCFWNPDLTFHENAVINYDWYHPQLCSRHTLSEVRQWFHENNVSIIYEHIDYYGITVRGKA